MIKITDNTIEFVKRNTSVFNTTLANMAQDVLFLSKIKVPLKSGDLQDSGKTEELAILKHRISYGDTLNDPRAIVQERGKAGSRVFRKYTTPDTGKKYLEDSANIVTSNALNYFRQAGNQKKLL